MNEQVWSDPIADLLSVARKRDSYRARIEAALRVIDALPPSEALTAVRAVLAEPRP